MHSTTTFKHLPRAALAMTRAGHGPRAFSSLYRPLQCGARPPSRTCSMLLGSGARASLPSMSRVSLRQLSSVPSRTEKPNMRFIWALIGLNVGIFGLWKYSCIEAEQAGIPQGRWSRSQVWLYQNFSLATNDLRDGKPWTYLTANFFHIQTGHLAFNLISFFYMARLLAQTPGIRTLHLAGLCAGAMVATTVGYSVSKRIQGAPPSRMYGFSGVVSAFMTASACMHPWSTFYIWGVLPVPAWGIAVGYFAYDYYRLNDSTSRTAHGGHIGGALFGLVYYLTVLRKTRGQSAPQVIQMIKQARKNMNKPR